MRTPAEFEPIAVWMGWGKGIGWHGGRWINAAGFEVDYIATKTSLTDAEAVEALRRLLEKECNYSLHGHKGAGGHLVEIFSSKRLGAYRSGWQPTAHAAVEEALLKLIVAEGGKE